MLLEGDAVQMEYVVVLGDAAGLRGNGCLLRLVSSTKIYAFQL